jgi:acetyl-CoA carboxylase carboxyltransferase component
VFVVVSRYHGGAFVVFSKALNERMEIAALEGSFASVIGGAPAAAAVFARDVRTRTEMDPRVRDAALATGPAARSHLAEVTSAVRSEKLGEVADEFDAIHSVERALSVGSIDRIIAARDLRPYLIDALDRGMAVDGPVNGLAGGSPRNGGVPQPPVLVDPPARSVVGTVVAPPL